MHPDTPRKIFVWLNIVAQKRYTVPPPPLSLSLSLSLQTPGRKRPPTASSSRRILAEKNTHHEPCPDESLFTQANFSLASTGSYTDFQVETYRQSSTL